MNLDNIPIIDLKFLKRISFRRTFTYNQIDADGNIIGPIDLTGKEVVAEFIGAIQTGTLKLSSNDPATPKGSQLTVTDAANAHFEFKLTGNELSSPVGQDGDWLLYVKDGPDAEALARGHIQFETITTGGTL
jgi:hypothetical protein